MIDKNQIQNLLEQVNSLKDKHEKILEASGGRFNIFSVCGVNHYENTHSGIIAEFLNPNGTHGLKSKFLECFIETLGEGFTVKDFNCQTATVRTEHTIDTGRLDILIEDSQNKAIIIENKIYAGDQEEQLQRYDYHANEKYKKGNYQILYLTLNGNEASEQSAGDIVYLPISYKKTVIDWLEKCVNIAARFPMVRETIIQYINHLKKLTYQDMDTKNKDEIVEMIVGNDAFLETVYDIYGNGIINACNCKIASNSADTIRKTANKLGLECEIDDNFGYKNTSARLYKTDWNFHIWLAFDEYLSDFYIGLKQKTDGACSEETVTKMREPFLNMKGFKFDEKTYDWIVYSYIDEWNKTGWFQRNRTHSVFIPEKIEAILDVLKGIK